MVAWVLPTLAKFQSRGNSASRPRMRGSTIPIASPPRHCFVEVGGGSERQPDPLHRLVPPCAHILSSEKPHSEAAEAGCQNAAQRSRAAAQARSKRPPRSSSLSPGARDEDPGLRALAADANRHSVKISVDRRGSGHAEIECADLREVKGWICRAGYSARRRRRVATHPAPAAIRLASPAPAIGPGAPLELPPPPPFLSWP